MFTYIKPGYRRNTIKWGASLTSKTPAEAMAASSVFTGNLTAGTSDDWNPILIDWQDQLEVGAFIGKDAYAWVAFPTQNPSYPSYTYWKDRGMEGYYRLDGSSYFPTDEPVTYNGVTYRIIMTKLMGLTDIYFKVGA